MAIDTDKLTPWFPPEIKPVYTGYYHTDKWQNEQDRLTYWDGFRWRHSLDRNWPLGDQNRSWRGLAEE